MKDVVVFLLALAVSIAGLGMWTAGLSPLEFLQTPSLSAQPITTEDAAIKPPTTAKKLKPPKIADAPRAVQPEQPATKVPVQVPVEVPAPTQLAAANIAPAAEAKTFNPNQIKIGAEKSGVVENMGAPSLLTKTSLDGHLIETYVYATGRNKSETVIQFQDGVVRSVASR